MRKRIALPRRSAPNCLWWTEFPPDLLSRGVPPSLTLGGLVALLPQIRGAATPENGELARRFALLAGFGLGIVALTGVLRSIVDI